jgi:VWFA-related protein
VFSSWQLRWSSAASLHSSPAARSQLPQDSNSAVTTSVVVDVIVRDRRGNPVTDLRPEEFELYEDDVRQQVSDVTLVAPGQPSDSHPQTSRTAAPTSSPESTGSTEDAFPSAVESPSFVALVFDRLSPEARALAHKGALAWVEGARPDDFAGVFLIDLHLETIQTYTNDWARVRQAIDEVSSRATTTFNRDANQVLSKVDGITGDLHPSVSPTASAEQQGQPDRVTAEIVKKELKSDSASGVRFRLASRLERGYEILVRDEQGYATTNGLLAVVDALGVLPGRKTVVFFAEGMAIPERVLARFDSVVATANRGNVSVYTVDAAGLRVHSKAAETARHVNRIGELGLSDRRDDQAWTKDLELNEDVLRQDPAASLGILADRTGGFLIDNTNDLERGFRQIDADRRFHYLLTYTPKNDNFSGEWRRIAVKVNRRDVTVRARSGYVAVRTPSALPLLAYEGPAMAALDRAPLPGEVRVRGAAFAFPQAQTAKLAVLVAADAGTLTFERDDRAKTYRTDFTVLARIRDRDGEIVRKGATATRVDRAKNAASAPVPAFFALPACPRSPKGLPLRTG